MGRQFIAMGMGMCIMPGGEGRFCLRVMSRVRLWVIHRVVQVIFLITYLVLAGLWPGVGLWIPGMGFWGLSR